MSSSFEKSVKGATKYKAAPPKSKYIEHILIATHSGESGVAEIFRTLQHRLRDSTWTVVFKSLITIHLMIREGSPDVTLSFLARNRHMLAIGNFSDLQTQGRNIRHYTNYLANRAKAFRETKCDFVRGATSRLEKLTVEKGLLREIEAVQHQISALLKCDVLDNEPENEITITVFRMLVLDLLSLFHTMNTGLINILGHFFEMSKIDAERALEIYKNFTEQTDYVVHYLSIARQYEYQTRLEVPKLKHAPVNLGKQLEDYLRDPDFEANRSQFLKEQEAKSSRHTNGKIFNSKTGSRPRAHSNVQATSGLSGEKISQSAKGPDPDLIDFFESIEQNQQTLTSQPEPLQDNFRNNNAAQFQLPEHQLFQQNSFVPEQMFFQNPNQFPQMFNNISTQQQNSQAAQQNFLPPEANGYTSQMPFQPGSLTAIPQNPIVSSYSAPISQIHITGPQPITVQTTNPFRQSMKMTNPKANGAFLQSSISPITPTNHTSTNPFTVSSNAPSQPFTPLPEQNLLQIPQALPSQSIGPIITGTNPFAKPQVTNTVNLGQGSLFTGGQPQPPGNTNPFRQSQLNNSVDSSWPGTQQPIGGGLDSLETIPVFPRPVPQQAWPY